MSTYSRPNIQQAAYAYSSVQYDGKAETTIHSTEFPATHSTPVGRRARRKYYTPTALRTPCLVVFCVVVLTILALLQVTSVAFMGTDKLQDLVSRSLETEPTSIPRPLLSRRQEVDDPTESDTLPSSTPTLAPDPGSFSDPVYDPDSSPIASPSETPTPTLAPGRGSFSDPEFDPESSPIATSSVRPGAPAAASFSDPDYDDSSAIASPTETPTLAPAPGSYSDPDYSPAAPLPSSTTPPTAPVPGSYSDPDYESNSASVSPSPAVPTPGAPAGGSFSDDDYDPGSGGTAPAGGSFSTTHGPGGKKSYYFIGGYLPTLIAILLTVWWKCIFTRIKEMEPFYQMAKPGGATAKDSLHLSYTGATITKVLRSSCVSGHRLSIFGAFNTILVTLCTLLASETVFLSHTGHNCRVIINPTEGKNKDCRITLAMRPILAWCLGAVLAVVIVLTICAIVCLRRRSSGITINPTSIAGTACLYDEKLAQEPLESLRSPLRRYAVAPSTEGETTSIVDLMVASNYSSSFPPVRNPSSSIWKNGELSMHPGSLATFWVFLVGLLVFVLYYAFVSKPGTGNALEDFMNSESFGVRLFMTILGLVVKFYWGWIEEYMRTMRPYLALASPLGATAAQSVLLRSPSHSITALFYSETWRHPLLGLVTLMAILGEALVITLNAVPFTTALAYLAFQLSVYISVGIVAVMIATLAVVLVWSVKVRIRHELPEKPECIADVFGLLGDPDGRAAIKNLCHMQQNGDDRSSHMRLALREREPRGSGWSIVELNPGQCVA